MTLLVSFVNAQVPCVDICEASCPSIPGDSEGDCLPDAWEEQYFNFNNNSTDFEDPDNDTLTNLREYYSIKKEGVS